MLLLRFAQLVVVAASLCCSPPPGPEPEPTAHAQGNTVLLPSPSSSSSAKGAVPTSSRPTGARSVLVPAPPKTPTGPAFRATRYAVEGTLAKAVPADILEQVDAAFAGRFDLYAQAAPPATLVTFSEKDAVVGALLITNKNERHIVGRAAGVGGKQAWFDFRGARTDEGPMLGRPLELSRVSSRFGERFHPISGERKEHRGVDYAAPTGTPVRATMDGTVKVRATDNAAGNHLKLRHGASYESWYLHLSSFAEGVSVGASIKKGDVIGYVGTTGASTGPHLHYELHLGPIVLDPLDLLPSKSAEVLPTAALAGHQERLRAMDALVR